MIGNRSRQQWLSAMITYRLKSSYTPSILAAIMLNQQCVLQLIGKIQTFISFWFGEWTKHSEFMCKTIHRADISMRLWLLRNTDVSQHQAITNVQGHYYWNH